MGPARIPRRSWLRLTRFYAATALLLLNLVVLVLILDVLARPARRLYRRVTATHSVKQLQEVYPGMSLAQISLLLSETWDRPWRYEPWVGFRERPRRGTYVNVSDEGFRLSRLKDLRLAVRGARVYVFGGSTTFGYGLDDGSTIPSRLQEHLDRRLGDRRVYVFNFGRGYYYSAQELALLLQLLRTDRAPRVAIFIDGLNEGQRAPYYSAEMSAMFDAHNYAPARFFGMLLESSSLVRFAREVTGAGPSRRTFDGDPSGIREEWLRNRRAIESLAERFSFSVYFFLQPVPGYRNSFARHKFMSPDGARMGHDLIRKMEALEGTFDEARSVSLTGLLEGFRGLPFVDDFHYTAPVCDSIAATIAGIVAGDRRLRRSSRADDD